MAFAKFGTLMHYLHTLVGTPAAEEASDAALLERFAVAGDEAAFESLVRRFGPMVLAVCRRVLADEHAAEDAFQATFLVLVRKARSVRRRELLGNWLYGVAYRTAMKARTRRAGADARERQVREMAADDPVQEAIRRDLVAVIDHELSRLPSKYRQALVLCYLEGHTNEAAARKLNCPCGTLFTRLSRGREMLRTRLERRGVALPAAALAAALAGEATASVPDALVKITLQTASGFAAGSAALGGKVSTAAALAEGVLQSMFVNKLKAVTAALVAVLVVGTGGAALAYRALADGPGDKTSGREPAVPQAARGTGPAAAGPAKESATPGPGIGGGAGKAGPASGAFAGLSGGLGCNGGRGFGFVGTAGPLGQAGAAFVGPGGVAAAGGLLGGGAAVAGPGVAFAGGGLFPAAGGGGCRLALLTQVDVQRDLGMTREQLKKLTEAQARQQKNVQRLMTQAPAGFGVAPDNFLQKLEDLHTEAEKAVDNVLTPSQRKRVQEIMLQQRGPLALSDPEVAEALKLTPDQKDKIKTVESDAAGQMQQVAAKAMETLQQAGVGPRTVQKLTKKIDEINKETGQHLLEVLSDEQKAKWKEMTGKPFPARKQ
jgi:RNA polymerase sigma factor (sigma-70 family)